MLLDHGYTTGKTHAFNFKKWSMPVPDGFENVVFQFLKNALQIGDGWSSLPELLA
jgi:hypothetical protein